MSEIPPARLRASDDDRERVIDVLRAAAGDGRIDLEEFEERADRVYHARLLGELPPIVEDLVPEHLQPIRVDQEPAVLAFFSDARRTGRWLVRARQSVLAVGATAELDLTSALLQRDHVVMHATALFGRVRVRVPDGVEVRVRGWSALGTRKTTVRRLPWGDGEVPVLEIHGASILGTVTVSGPPRARRLPWRRNRPKAVGD